MLGLYVAKTVDIWWELRHGQVQTILNTIDGLSMRMAIYFPGTSPEDMEAKNTILRYGALSVKLLFKDCKEIDAWTLADRMESGCDNLIDLENEGLITPDEVELLMNCPCKSQVVWVWIASYVTKWCLDGRLPNPLENQEKILEECIEARNAIANILARINTQFPLSYTHLVVFMIKFLLFVHGERTGRRRGRGRLGLEGGGGAPCDAGRRLTDTRPPPISQHQPSSRATSCAWRTSRATGTRAACSSPT